jgi:hypothetical protein
MGLSIEPGTELAGDAEVLSFTLSVRLRTVGCAGEAE